MWYGFIPLFFSMLKNFALFIIVDSSDPSNPNNLCCTEKQEVSDFITKNQANGGIIDLLYKYAVILGAKSNLTWYVFTNSFFSLLFCDLISNFLIFWNESSVKKEK